MDGAGDGAWGAGGGERGRAAAEWLDEGRRLRKLRKPCVPYSREVERAILRRVARGEALTSICSEPGMPTNGTVSTWARERPRFGKALRRAKEAGGWTSPTHPGPAYCEAQAMEIYARLCEGESLKSICADPEMPGHSTVYRWRERFPEFAATIRAAREVQAELFCDEGVDIMRGVTPQTAYAASVQLAHLRWTAGVRAPKRFGRFKPVEWADEEPPAADDAGGPQEVVFRVRHFERVTGEDGKAYLREVVDQLPPRLATEGDGVRRR